MKNLFLLVIAGFLFVHGSAQEVRTIQLMDSAQFEQAILQDSVMIVDVRTPEEYKSGHIPGAINVDFLASDFKEKMGNFDTSRPLYIYCRSGKRSAKAAQTLEEMNFLSIGELKGGILSWEKELQY